MKNCKIYRQPAGLIINRTPPFASYSSSLFYNLPDQCINKREPRRSSGGVEQHPQGAKTNGRQTGRTNKNKAGTKRSEGNKIEVQTEGNEEVEGRDGGKKRSTCCPYAKENASGE